MIYMNHIIFYHKLKRRFEQIKFYLLYKLQIYSLTNDLFINPTKILMFSKIGISPHNEKKILETSNRILSHCFDLFGSGNMHLGVRIDWSCDYKSGDSWPKKYYTKINKFRFNNSDIKFPWELNRFQHLTLLGESFILTNEKKYLVEFENEINDWICENPFCHGVNWTCPMEVAIRAVNWIMAYHYFEAELNEEFKELFFKILIQHGKFIEYNLETGIVTANHYLSNIVGLIWISLFIGKTKYSREWFEYGREELICEMQNQIYSDGVNFEASTCYHRLVLELFAYTAIVCKQNNVDLPDSFWVRLEKMFDFVLHYLTPGGTNPQVGDNDNGRLLVFRPRDILDNTYLLSMAAVLFKDARYKLRNFGFDEEVLWFFGEEGRKIHESLEYASLPGSKAYAEGGFYIIRNQGDYCFVSCGPVGQEGLGGHSHNDKLSFVLWVDGKELFVDPGTYSYTGQPKLRNIFRSTRYHNTVMIDGYEQNPFHEKSLFRLKDHNTNARCLEFNESDKDIIFQGEHYGYTPVIHNRQIRYDKKTREWCIIDTFKGNGEHILEWNFHLSDKIKEIQVNDKKILIEKKFTINLPFKPKIINCWVSPSYGVKKKSKAIRFSIRTNLDKKQRYTIFINSIKKC